MYGIIDIETGEACLCQAGHPAPIHYAQSEQSISTIANGGYLVGVFDKLTYAAHNFTLLPGDSLCIYSDGVTECFSAANEAIGEQRLFDLIQNVKHSCLTDTLREIENAVINWNDSDEFSDDISIMVLKRH